MRAALANHRYLFQQGFTLIELLLVIGIMAIVGTAVVVSYNSKEIYSQSETTLAEADKLNLINAIDQYYFSHKSWPGGIDNQAKMIGTAITGCDVYCQIDGQTQRTAPVCLNLKNVLGNETLVTPIDKNLGSEEKSFYAVKVSGTSAKFYPCDNNCQANCTNKECGDDGCSGNCGTCTGFNSCDANQKCTCIKNCSGKVCGTDGCGGTCGTCRVDELCTAESTCQQIPLTIGMDFLGGKLAYILKSGDLGYDKNIRHGLVAASANQGSFAWGCDGIDLPGAAASGIGYGKQNTIDIVTGCTQKNIAAQICSDLVLNSYDDWYLPATYELKELYNNKTAIGGFLNGNYKSSTETTKYYSLNVTFSNGSIASGAKGAYNYVRCIRSF